MRLGLRLAGRELPHVNCKGMSLRMATLSYTTKTARKKDYEHWMRESCADVNCHEEGARTWGDLGYGPGVAAHSNNRELRLLEAVETAAGRHTDTAQHSPKRVESNGNALEGLANDSHWNMRDQRNCCAHSQRGAQRLQVVTSGVGRDPSGPGGHRPHIPRRSPHFLVMPVDDDVDAGRSREKCVV